jgi:hypothetical protein
LSRFVVEVLKTYQIFLHQITPEAVIRMGIFVWAVRSQGLNQVQDVFAVCMNFRMRRRPGVKNNIITISVAIASLLALTQATQCQRFGSDGPGPGWKSGFT